MSEEKQLLSLADRRHLKINGVLHVASFDDQEVILETNLGVLIIKGEGLNINQFNLEQGKLEIDGMIRLMEYKEGEGVKDLKDKRKGLLERLLR
ncbi:sporulation protein YabP [Calderihabitans maritimus]|uniref:YabP family protein n=1 Tax=Calderihabitans maritimus TaxID=1246530 RepID=A0A1Z5HSI0_9FIRM|nr:sporulation protein YabP [Calderihabitans maritimus]GAW92240.1 YabP family protein [Calderihabitans maritimus]